MKLDWKGWLIIGAYITIVWPMITGLFTTILPDLGNAWVNWGISIFVNGAVFLFIWRYLKGYAGA